MANYTRRIYVGNVAIGGGAPVSVQSMTNTDTKDIESTVRQILEFEKRGCDISRSAINCLEDAKAIPIIKSKTNIPLVADIQFDYRLAKMAVDYDCDCLRINPGNIGNRENLKEVIDMCKKKHIPIRVGVNSGSIHKSIIDKFGGVNVNSLVHSALEEVKLLESLDFYDIKVSIKSSDVRTMIDAYTMFSKKSDVPLHLGVTEAGLPLQATVKSAVGIGSLLSQGIGDTLRVSITGDPVEEVTVGKEILRSLGLVNDGLNLVSCPTCARTKIDLIGLAQKAEKVLKEKNTKLNIAIMGCPVNGPGEAKEADLGIAGGVGYGIIFRKGKIIKRVPENELLDELLKEIDNYEKEK